MRQCCPVEETPHSCFRTAADQQNTCRTRQGGPRTWQDTRRRQRPRSCCTRRSRRRRHTRRSTGTTGISCAVDSDLWQVNGRLAGCKLRRTLNDDGVCEVEVEAPPRRLERDGAEEESKVVVVIDGAVKKASRGQRRVGDNALDHHSPGARRRWHNRGRENDKNGGRYSCGGWTDGPRCRSDICAAVSAGPRGAMLFVAVVRKSQATRPAATQTGLTECVE